jgi:hypothetical protein
MIYYMVEKPFTNRVKIGYTRNNITLKNRLSQLQIGNPTKLEIIGVMDGNYVMERKLHKILSDYRLESEWFEMCEPLCKYINSKTKSWSLDLILESKETFKLPFVEH